MAKSATIGRSPARATTGGISRGCTCVEALAIQGAISPGLPDIIALRSSWPICTCRRLGRHHRQKRVYNEFETLFGHANFSMPIFPEAKLPKLSGEFPSLSERPHSLSCTSRQTCRDLFPRLMFLTQASQDICQGKGVFRLSRPKSCCFRELSRSRIQMTRLS